jgi:hypothetical protein
MPFEHKPKTIKQLKESFNRRCRDAVNDFIDFDDFLNWYNDQELSCNYCGLTEVESQEISIRSILTSNRFPQNGIIGQGKSRAVWLEVDRINSNGSYSRENCVLCCYFCNNDKSDVFSGEMYSQFFQNRAAFLRELLINNPEV